MKRICAAILLLLLLTGCSGFTPDSYLSVRPHREQQARSGDADVVIVENYPELRAAILGFVQDEQEEGVIRIHSYDGDVETDVAEAAYEVSKQDPLGAYAVDYMTHECVRVVSYYEINIRTTFRRTKEEIDGVEQISNTIKLQERVEQALEQCQTGIVLRMDSYWEQDIVGMAQRYAEANPDLVPEQPQVTVTAYPQSGPARILEIAFGYTQTPEALLEKRKEILENRDGAAEYIRYRQTARDKAELLYTYLTTRFSYALGETVTPLYSALCEGIADPVGLAQAWQLICDRAGVECFTVTGSRGGEPYRWNIIFADGVYRHLDLSRSILEEGRLRLLTDGEMTEYYWETDDYPACQ